MLKLTIVKPYIHTYISTYVYTIVLASRIPTEIFAFIVHTHTDSFLHYYVFVPHLCIHIFCVCLITAAKLQSFKLVSVFVAASRVGISITSHTRFHAKKGRNCFIIADWQALTFALFLLSFVYFHFFFLLSLYSKRKLAKKRS